MRKLASTILTGLAVGLAVRFGAELSDQLQDSTSTLRLTLAELHDRLREVTP